MTFICIGFEVVFLIPFKHTNIECFGKSLLVFGGFVRTQKGYYHMHSWRTRKYQLEKYIAGVNIEKSGPAIEPSRTPNRIFR